MPLCFGGCLIVFRFSVPGGLFVGCPSFPFRFRPSLPGLLFRIVVSLVFGQPVGAPSFPCLPCFHLNIYEVFSCVASCASSLLSLCVPSVPVSSPFCNPCRPLHFSVPIRSVAPMRLLCFPCVRLLSSSIHLSLPRASSFFYSLCPSLFIFPLYTAPDTYPIFSLCAFHPGTSSSLSSFLPFLFSVLGLSVSPSACFQSRCPHLPGAIPPFPRRLSFLFLLRSRVFLPLFSALFLSFVFHLEKSFPLKSRVISSVKYMFYSIFLVYMRKFS